MARFPWRFSYGLIAAIRTRRFAKVEKNLLEMEGWLEVDLWQAINGLVDRMVANGPIEQSV